MSARFTEEQFAQLMRDNVRLRPSTTPSREVYEAKATKPRKYRNQKTEIEGILFDSKKESTRWQELRLLYTAGKIHDLRRQVAYALHINGELVGRYTPDFRYVENGRVCCEDVKSPITQKAADYRFRVRVFRALYPEIDFREV